MTDHLPSAISYYLLARDRLVAAGFEREISWQKALDPQAITERDLLREAAWVVLCSGFREATVRARFSQISLCFCDWESSEEIVANAEACRRTASSVFGNGRKIAAILSTAHVIAISGFASIKARILANPISALLRFDYIGDITAFHLAKNLGFQVAKQDRHLARLSSRLGFCDADNLCRALSLATGDPVNTVDLVLWRDCVLAQQSHPMATLRQ